MKIRLTRDSWLQAGFHALDKYGYEAVSAQALARRLNVTRGSFYHHFASRQDFIAQLLGRWEVEYTVDVISEAHSAADPLAMLQRYIAVVAKLKPGREVAIRAWAGKDKRVNELLQRVDGLRLEFARESARALLPPSAKGADVEALAQLAFLALIGLVHTGGQGDGRFHQLFAYLTDFGTRLRND
ncbi:TetR/AcrR family transcriptional regulator [Massilia violaceinigra]|uniref:TetR/AcrR family transcriptional regulator n=1 Tax=Massilia violaceinigra TaxID=2045208 RepID=UPI0012FD8652|nr:TetR/AcrR family transcriptional regulator [Massilia violaceinigra]